MKELGLLATNCPCLAEDISKIFSVYWQLSKPKAVVPDTWPPDLSTSWNIDNPVCLKINDTDANVYIAVSCKNVGMLRFFFSLHQQNFVPPVGQWILMLC